MASPAKAAVASPAPRLVKPGSSPPRKENVPEGNLAARDVKPAAAPDHSKLQLAVTKIVLENIIKAANKVVGGVVSQKGELFINSCLLNGAPKDGKYTLNNLPPAFQREYGDTKKITPLNGSKYLAAMREINFPNVIKYAPVGKDLDIGSLESHQKSLYEAVMYGVGNAFFVPKEDPATIEALKVFNLSKTQEQIAATLDVKKIAKQDLLASTIVAKQAFEAAMKYAPKGFQSTPWSLKSVPGGSRVAEIATAVL